MSTDYNYDDQVYIYSTFGQSNMYWHWNSKAQFFPFFILTITSLVTLPLTYSLLKPSKGTHPPSLDPRIASDWSLELESTAPRIRSNFKPEHEDLILGQKKKQRRRERRLKRFLAVVTGYLVMGWMAYLIVVTQRTVPKIWDPYDILKVSRVSILHHSCKTSKC